MIEKATEMQICVYDWYRSDGGTLVIPARNGQLTEMLSEIVRGLQEKHSGSLNIDVTYCDLNVTDNQVLYARMGATTTPVVAVAGRYEDGTEVAYFLEEREKKPLRGIPFTIEAIQPYVEAVLYKAYGKVSLFCKAVRSMGLPYLCNWEKWLYLAGGIIGGTNAYTTDNTKKQALWGAASGYCLYIFYKKGGVDDLKKLLK